MFRFIPFQEKHLSLFQGWLSQDHVKPFWQEPESIEELKNKFFGNLPQRGVYSFLIEENSKLIGYIQYYNAREVGGGWWIDEAPGTFGIDVMIGEPSRVGKGIGALVISEFVSFILEKEPTVTSIIIDPEPSNKKAIHAFEKAGFKVESEIKTPNGLALLMRLKLKSLADKSR